MKPITVATALLVAAAPLAVADGPADDSEWGRCQAYFAAETGNDNSNGTVYDTPPFQNLSEEECEETSPPYEGTPAEEHAGDHPGQNAQDPGSQAPDDPGDDEPPENPGDDERPDATNLGFLP